MYEQSYEDYMRMVLGYQPNREEGCMPCSTYQNFQMPTNIHINNINNTSTELDNLYPNIFHILKPIVEKVCNENTKAMCKEVLEEMTDTIYHIVEEREEITTITETKVTTKSMENRNSSKTENRLDSKNSTSQNFLLRDLIKILILNRIFNQNRPPRPGPGPRPPFPGPNPRPPMPRIYDYI